MSEAEPRHVLRPSILHRLLRRTDIVQRPGWQADLGADELRREVKWHLEEILNARVLVDSEELRAHPEAARSLLRYGLPDLSQFARARRMDLERMRGLIHDAIAAFEPRLDPKTIRVELDTDAGTHRDDFSVRFRILATLDVEPIREDVAFDTSVEVATGSVAVRESD